MAEATARAAWGRTSALMAMLANCHRDRKKSRPCKASDFDPFAAKRQTKLPKADIRILKEVFIDRKFPGEVLKCEES